MTHNGESFHSAHWSFWAVAGVTLLFNAAGVANFISQLSADGVSAMPDAYRAIVEARPAWATGAFAIAVFGGAVGCALLLLRKPAALFVFIVSLLGAIATMIHTLGIAPFEWVVGNLIQVLVTAFLIWYSRYVQTKGWIG